MGSFLSALYNPGQFFGTNYGIGSAINSITGASESAYKQYKYQKKLQKQAQEFAKWQMGNAHQLEVQDLQNAGLNPVLSAGGSGADAGGVSMGSASTGTPAADPISMVGSIIGMMNSSKQTNALVDKTEAEVNNINADTTGKNINNKYLPEVTQSMINLNNATTSKSYQEKQNLLAQEQFQYIKNQILKAEKDINYNDRTIKERKENMWKLIDNQGKLLEIQANKIGINSKEWKQAWDITMGMVNDFMSSWSPLTDNMGGGNTYNFTNTSNSPTVNY